MYFCLFRILFHFSRLYFFFTFFLVFSRGAGYIPYVTPGYKSGPEVCIKYPTINTFLIFKFITYLELLILYSELFTTYSLNIRLRLDRVFVTFFKMSAVHWTDEDLKNFQNFSWLGGDLKKLSINILSCSWEDLKLSKFHTDYEEILKKFFHLQSTSIWGRFLGYQWQTMSLWNLTVLLADFK